jgi:hypothetical protein
LGNFGQTALGAAGFNVPSLLGICYHRPFLHNGSAQTLAAVFPLHQLPGGGTIQIRLNATQRMNLLDFLCSIDDPGHLLGSLLGLDLTNRLTLLLVTDQ